MFEKKKAVIEQSQTGSEKESMKTMSTPNLNIIN